MKGFLVMNDNHLYAPSADDLKDKMRTIPRLISYEIKAVQQSPNLCDNRCRKILWSTVSNAAERSRILVVDGSQDIIMNLNLW